MADYFPGAIHIGGPIRSFIVKRLIAAIVDEGVSLDDYGGPAATEEDLRRAFEQRGDVVRLYDDEARYGQFDELEEFLVRHRIHFDRHSDSRYEFDAENAYYRGGKHPLVMLATESGQPLVACEEVLEILGNAGLGEPAKLEAIRRLVSPPEMSPLAPVQLISGATKKGGAQPCLRKESSTSPG